MGAENISPSSSQPGFQPGERVVPDEVAGVIEQLGMKEWTRYSQLINFLAGRFQEAVSLEEVVDGMGLMTTRERSLKVTLGHHLKKSREELATTDLRIYIISHRDLLVMDWEREVGEWFLTADAEDLVSQYDGKLGDFLTECLQVGLIRKGSSSTLMSRYTGKNLEMLELILKEYPGAANKFKLFEDFRGKSGSEEINIHLNTNLSVFLRKISRGSQVGDLCVYSADIDKNNWLWIDEKQEEGSWFFPEFRQEMVEEVDERMKGLMHYLCQVKDEGSHRVKERLRMPGLKIAFILAQLYPHEEDEVELIRRGLRRMVIDNSARGNLAIDIFTINEALRGFEGGEYKVLYDRESEYAVIKKAGED